MLVGRIPCVLSIACKISSSQEKQVLFTADLKVFSSYGMPASSSTSIETTSSSTPTETPASRLSSNKRMRKTVPLDTDELPVIIDPISQDDVSSLMEDTSLAERVKRRRRAVE